MTYLAEKENPTSWLDLFRTPKMRLRFLLITITWSVIKYVIQLYKSSIQYQVYVLLL